MKIVTWNCNGAFREKYEHIFEEKADIYVIQECENPNEPMDKYNEYKESMGDNFFWTGNLHYKGLGIFAKEGVKLEKIETNGNFEHFLLLRVKDKFNLLGVWAMNKNKEKGLSPYVEMIHDFLEANEDVFDENLVMCGDLNSNVVFNDHHKKKDAFGDPKNHTYLNMKLNCKHLFSAYHYLTGEEQGKETKATFFQARHLNDPYHLDHVYSKKGVVKKNLQILDNWEWINLSDHLPVVFEIDESKFD